MADDAGTRSLSTSRLGRFASMARAGLGTATALVTGSGAGLELAVDRLGELRGLGTKVGQMAGLVEANLPDDLRAKVGPALAKLRDQTATSPWESVRELLVQELGEAPETAFARFDPTPFASASLGQVHRATLHDGRSVAVKVQHPGIREAFEGDLANVTGLGRLATTFVMPENAGRAFLDSVKGGFLAELDYRAEAAHGIAYADFVRDDPDLVVPGVVVERSTERVLTTEMMTGGPVERARGFPDAERKRLAAAARRFLVGSLVERGMLYADAHAGNFLFEEGKPLVVLDFGSVFRFDEDRRAKFLEVARAAQARDDVRFEHAVGDLVDIHDPPMRAAIARVQTAAFGAIVRGDAIDRAHVRDIMERAKDFKSTLIRRKAALAPFMPFVMRTTLATAALLATLEAGESGPLELPSA